MRVLVACEESQRVAMAFRNKGHEAFSCDIQESSGGHPEYHIKGDVLPLLNGSCGFQTEDGERHLQMGKWDLLICHPECTYLSNAGTRHFSPKCNTPEKIKEREILRDKAAEFFMKMANANCDKIAIENPVGYMKKYWRKYDQIIHPYYFAESVDDLENYHQKRTCLWLKGLPLLKKTNNLPKPEPIYISEGGKPKPRAWTEGIRGTTGGQKGRAKAMSKTFRGIAEQMAEQWG